MKAKDKKVILHDLVQGDDMAMNYGYVYWRAEIGEDLRETLRDMAQSVRLHGCYSMTSFSYPCEVASDRKFEELRDPDGLELVVCDDCFFWRWEVGDHGFATTDLISLETLEKEWAKL